MLLRIFAFLLSVVLAAPVSAHDFFRIQVIDDATGRGVPLVELRTVNNLRFVTDSNGLIAFQEPGLMGRDVFFYVESHGYEFPADGFGIRGRKLRTEPGLSATLKIKRQNIAERLYRLTGAGIYRDTVLLGEQSPTREPLLNGQVLGSDSVQSVIYNNRLIWFWGDTNRPSYPLGNFDVPGATSLLPGHGGLDPSIGVDTTYFVDETGFARPTCRMPGSGPTWIDALVTLRDQDGRERLFAKYVKVKPPLSVYEQGLVEFNNDSQQFEQRVVLEKDASNIPFGHSFRFTEPGSDREYVYFADPYALVRTPATSEALLDPAQYESFTYYKAGAVGTAADPPEVDRDADGRLVLNWKRNARPLELKLEDRFVRSGRLKADERFFQFVAADSGKRVVAHRGSIAFNPYRNCWIMIFTELGGASMLGEVWYAESASITGPWQRAVKIATHNKYSFYNPKHHSFFDQDGGQIIYFEGTYTATFSGNEFPTQRYDYNQMMYRLDLSDPRLR